MFLLDRATAFAANCVVRRIARKARPLSNYESFGSSWDPLRYDKKLIPGLREDDMNIVKQLRWLPLAGTPSAPTEISLRQR